MLSWSRQRRTSSIFANKHQQNKKFVDTSGLMTGRPFGLSDSKWELLFGLVSDHFTNWESLYFGRSTTIPEMDLYYSISFTRNFEIGLIPDFLPVMENLEILNGYFQFCGEEQFHVIKFFITGSVLKGSFIRKQSYDSQLRCHSLRKWPSYRLYRIKPSGKFSG